MPPSRLVAMLFAGLVLASPAVCAAQTRGKDPDWPCQQRLVPRLTAAVFWSGPSLDGIGNWQDEPRIADLVRRISPRQVSPEVGEAAIADFAEKLAPDDDRNRLLTLAFAGLLEETNDARSELLSRIKQFGRRQRDLAATAASLLDEQRAIPADATGEAAERRADLEQRLAFTTRAFEGSQRTIGYVCDAPVRLEARLGRYARALQSHLS
jgi:hypothetical protein